MTTINETFTNAILADATYVHGLKDGMRDDILVGKLSDRMSLVLAEFKELKGAG